MFVRHLRIKRGATKDFVPAEQYDLKKLLLLVLVVDTSDMRLQRNIFRRGRKDIEGPKGGGKCQRFGNFSINFGRGEFVDRPSLASLALQSDWVERAIACNNVHTILALTCPAMAHE
jgi:hypothetical protein